MGYLVRPWGGTARVTSPFTVRVDSWAKKTAGEYDYTDTPGSRRYGHGTANGGIVFLPPETDILLLDDLFTISGGILSETYVAVSAGVRWAAGLPDEATGGISDGYDWGMGPGSALVFRTRNASAVASDAFRLTAGQLVAFRASTDFWGTLSHAITADRTWKFPDASGTVAFLDDIPEKYDPVSDPLALALRGI